MLEADIGLLAPRAAPLRDALRPEPVEIWDPVRLRSNPPSREPPRDMATLNKQSSYHVSKVIFHCLKTGFIPCPEDKLMVPDLTTRDCEYW